MGRQGRLHLFTCEGHQLQDAVPQTPSKPRCRSSNEFARYHPCKCRFWGSHSPVEKDGLLPHSGLWKKLTEQLSLASDKTTSMGHCTFSVLQSMRLLPLHTKLSRPLCLVLLLLLLLPLLLLPLLLLLFWLV